jgi:mannosyltransferase
MTHPPHAERSDANDAHPEPHTSRNATLGASAWACAGIAFVGAGLRFYQLDRLSFWYDEVVTMRLARAGSAGELFDRLFEIDATRAPLHPLLLQVWLRFFGTSEFAARSFSVVCGIATIVLIYQIGRAAFDSGTGLWAAWLAALSPILIVYSREARMYAWLLLVTCLCWRLLLALRHSLRVSTAAAYVLCLAALVLSHPLGLLMLATLALAGLIDVRAVFGSARRWLAVHLAATILILPWVANYFDHPPEFLSGRLPLRFLLGTPIGFIGGNALLMLGLVALIAMGIFRSLRSQHERLTVPVMLLCWLIIPPVALYLYSLMFQPIFGPARYTAFVAPAYLVLVASGLSRLPTLARYPVATGLAVVSFLALSTSAYDPELKADWRGFSADLAKRRSRDPDIKMLVIVASTVLERDVEVETARYYLPAGCEVIGSREVRAQPSLLAAVDLVFYVAGSRGSSDQPVPESIGPYRFPGHRHYPGLNVYRGAR